MLQALRADNSPFSDEQIARLQSGLADLNPQQSLWLSGYLAGVMAAEPGAQNAPDAAAAGQPAGQGLAIVYASQTGNGEALAETLAAQLQSVGVAADRRSMASLRGPQLAKMDHGVFIISTHGDGDPPDDAMDLFDYLERLEPGKLDQLTFSVLALGDSSYPEFCAAGRRLQELLSAAGARCFLERVECDLDFETAASDWQQQILDYADEHLKQQDAVAPSVQLSVVPEAPAWDRKRPFAATLNQVQSLTGRGSTKDVRHIALSLEGSGLRYQPGDALAVHAENDPMVVDAVLEALALNPETPVSLNDREAPLSEVLARRLELTRLTPEQLKTYAEQAGAGELNEQIAALDQSELRHFVTARQWLDLLQSHPVRIEAQSLVDLLRPLSPRAYSIASSPLWLEDEVHLTVATLESNAVGQRRFGVASHWLNHRLDTGSRVPVHVDANRRFHLPEAADTPLVMIAAGTGVAPYRAFLQHLESQGANPDSWLIFGNPHMRTDFLYQKDWLDYRRRGLLNRIDVAFSRDGREKYYVQDVVRDQTDRLRGWLDRGAVVYICGSLAMGRAVEQALSVVLSAGQGPDTDEARAAIADLRRQRRLRTDLY